MKKIIFFSFLFLVGCASLGLLSNTTKPTVKIIDAKVNKIALDHVELLFDLDIYNPYEVPLPITNLKYTLSSKGKEFLSGDSQDIQGSIPAKGNKTINFPVKVLFAGLYNVLSEIRPGNLVPYEAKIIFSVDAPVVGQLSLPISKEGKIPIPTIPDVRISNINWSELSFSKAEAVVDLEVLNQNDFDLNLSEIFYNLKLGGVEVAKNSIKKEHSFGKKQKNTFKIPIGFSPMSLGLSAFNMLKGSTSPYSMEGKMIFNSEFGPITLPFKKDGDANMKK